MNNLLIGGGAIAGIVCGAVVLLAIVILAVWYVSTYNKLKRVNNMVDEGWATIDVHLKKRYDLIPNLVGTVKGYAKHESETLEKVIAARKTAMTAGTPDEKAQAENMLSGTLKSLFSLKLEERYPELKANTNFMDLMNQLKSVENEIASARRYYNGTVKELNTLLDYFFTGMVGRKMRLEKRKYFELESEEERKAPQVKF
ncbi:MAG: LemA family protein [Candidatus Gallimonas sp.]